MSAAPVIAALDLPEEVRSGATHRVTAIIRNTASTTQPVYLRGRETVFDLVVRDDAGHVVWRRLDGEVTMAILQLRELAAGDSLAFTAAWRVVDQDGRPLSPGRYTMTVEFPVDDGAVLVSFARPFLVN